MKCIKTLMDMTGEFLNIIFIRMGVIREILDINFSSDLVVLVRLCNQLTVNSTGRRSWLMLKFSHLWPANFIAVFLLVLYLRHSYKEGRRRGREWKSLQIN